MFVLISFVLVLVATGLLVVGFVQGGLALIYISIACSIAAGIILAVAVKVARPTATPAAVAPTQTSAPVSAESVTAAVAVVTVPSDDEADQVDLAPGATASDDDGYEDDDDDFFPIADYDELRVNEILPLLPELYADELDVVEERERAGKARKVVLSRIVALRAVAPVGDEAVADHGVDAELATAVIEEEWAAADDDEEEGFFPIADYDELRVSEILPLLSQLTRDELVEVRQREVAGANRKSILGDIDRRTGVARTIAPVRVAAARRGPSTNGSAEVTKPVSARKPRP